jgi:HSP20 family protein
MAITRYEPANLLAQFHDEIGRLCDARFNPVTEWTPAVDVRETEREYVIHADVPGVKPEDIDITLENDVLTIKGSRNWEDKQEAGDYKRVERARGTFFRRFVLPDTADSASVSAKNRDGVLEVVIPKKEKAQPRKIKINS